MERGERLESHAFESVPVLQWRNTMLDFRSIEALLESLACMPNEEGLTRAPVADDVRVLERAAREDEVRELATTPKSVQLLWGARQAALADRTDGDIDTLSYRIAQVRTWTFAANRSDWLEDPEHWQGITRGVEDKLSDALHERLAQRFVD